jgi:hypothetical protein
MRNSIAAAGERKSTSTTAAPIPTPRMEEHRHEEVDEHRLLLLLLLDMLPSLHGGEMEGSRRVGGTLACVGHR